MTTPTVHTFRGRSLEEILPQIRRRLGSDAVVVGRREVLSGGVGGFFAKRELEVEARPPRPRVDIVEDQAATPDPPVEDPFAEHLARLGADPRPAAPAVEPVLFPRVSEIPTLEDVLPEPRPDELARLFAQAPIVEDDPDEPLPAADEPLPAADEPLPAPSSVGFSAQVTENATVDVDALLERGLSPHLAAEVHDEAVARLPLAATPDLDPLLREALARRIPIAAPRTGATGVVGFVGPGGSGKTRCVARMATAYATRGTADVAVVTLRPKDGGAELQRLLAPVGVPIHAEDDAAAAAARIDALREHALVILDTPGVSPRAEAQARVLADELRQLRADELHVCVPATMAFAPGRRLLGAGRELGATAMTITHADEAEELGAAVELAIDATMPIALLARGESLQSGLRPAVADDLAHALVP